MEQNYESNFFIVEFIKSYRSSVFDHIIINSKNIDELLYIVTTNHPCVHLNTLCQL